MRMRARGGGCFIKSISCLKAAELAEDSGPADRDVFQSASLCVVLRGVYRLRAAARLYTWSTGGGGIEGRMRA